MEEGKNNKPKRHLPVWPIMLIALLVVILIGGGVLIYYHYSGDTSGEETDENSTSSGVVTDWKKESRKVILGYLKYTVGEAPSFKSSFTEGNDYITDLGTQKFRTENLNNYLLCVRNWQTVHPEKLVLHADVINGIQDIAAYEIVSLTQTGEDNVTVAIRFAFFTPHDVNYYLVSQDGNWLIDSTSEIEKMIKNEYVKKTTGCEKE